MSLILHLSDLHLLPRSEDESIGDYKSKFAPIKHRKLRVDLIEDTLRALARRLTNDGERLAAVVVSGDVTTAGSAEGMRMLPGLLGQLGDRLPPRDRIVVVPGNHDSSYLTAPSSPERYQVFIDVARHNGYVTPFLEGADDQATHGAKQCLVHDDFVICAVNSSDYAGALEPLNSAVQRQLDELARPARLGVRRPPRALLDKIEALRVVDAARINPVQLRLMADALASVDPGHDRVRMVTFHHQVLPVSLNEELKPFESLSNLAEVQGAILDSEVDVVLHGHKHVPALLNLSAPTSDGRSRGRSCAVIAVGTVGAMVGVGNEVAKLLRVERAGPRTRTMSVHSIPALGAGGRMDALPEPRRVVLSSPAGPDEHVRLVQGSTVGDVHEQLMTPGFEQDIAGPIVCVIGVPSTPVAPPLTYPVQAPPGDLAGWFEGQVKWWQSADVAAGKPFTHGDFIRRWHGVRDQFEDAIKVLRRSPQTSRALISLFDPDRGAELPIPSFSVLHLKIRSKRLEMLAFFRKHEMRYWWAINASEIAMLQADAVARLSEPGREVTAGPIVTVSAETVFSSAMPKVAVPVIDQLAWNGSYELAAVASAVFDPAMPRRREVVDRAVRWLQELRPPAQMPSDGAYISVAGPLTLQRYVTNLARAYDSATSEAERIVAALAAFVDVQKTGDEYASGETADGYPEWAGRSRAALDSLEQAMRQLNPPAT